MLQDRFFIYYTIGSGESLGYPNFPGIVVNENERNISIPVKANFTIESLVDNNWKTSDPQVGLLIREIQLMNSKKKDFKIWKTEVKTNVNFDETTEFIKEKTNQFINYSIIAISILLFLKFFTGRKRKK
ncbi:MAG: hypothetical protein L6Q54_15335 [Leptospiraceae bacterium]|nr:hypothetical protein [Leptospiraceae bacterium]MCK6382607.1 hypothetical protein [Leptospiraceae bacterium]